MSPEAISRSILQRIRKQHQAITAQFAERLLKLGNDLRTLPQIVERYFIEKFDAYALEVVPFSRDLQRHDQIHECYPKLLDVYARLIVDRDLAKLRQRWPRSPLQHLQKTLATRLQYRKKYWLAKVSYALLDAAAPQEAPGRKGNRKAKKPVRRNQKSQLIDEALQAIAESRPRTQIEVFQSLDRRGVTRPLAEPFSSARGWVAGFNRDEPVARAWRSKRWTELNLASLPRGPKSPRE